MNFTDNGSNEDVFRRVETCLESHPSVKRAAVVPRTNKSGKQVNVAFVELEGHIEADGTKEFERGHVSEWEGIFNATYSGSLPNLDTSLQQVGWNSSYTGLPIEMEEMDDWLSATLKRISYLKRNHILEIGCGTGMLLDRLADSFTSYVGTDFSEKTVESLRQKFTRTISGNKSISIILAEAKDFSKIPKGPYDLIIINSVVQYFPGVDYLDFVMKNAVELLSDGGAIFIGDVRDYRLIDEFHLSVLLHGTRNKIRSRSDTHEQLARGVDSETELLIDPTWFHLLSAPLSSALTTTVQPKISKFANEMSSFRYDVVIRKGSLASVAQPVRWLECSPTEVTVEFIRNLLANADGQPFGLSRLENPFISPFVSDFRETILKLEKSRANKTISCYEFASICQQMGYRAYFFTTPADSASTYNVVVSEIDSTIDFELPNGVFLDSENRRLSNDPLFGQKNASVAVSLRAFVEKHLPGLAPRTIVRTASIPLTSNGDVDRTALLSRVHTQTI